MIDFRYHVVSLASVLIALAVGIVLGAGPLKEGISDSLNQQVTSLRAEKADLRSELDAAQSTVKVQENFADAQLSRMVAGRLADRSITLVALPGTADALLSDTEDTLGAAGATLIGPIDLPQAWTDPSEAAASTRSQLAAQLAPTLGLAEDASLDAVLGTVLLAKLPATPDDQTNSISEIARQAAWNTLADAGLVSGVLPTDRGSLVVVLSPATAATTATTSTDTAAPYAAQAKLVAALDDASDGSVIVGQVDPAAADSSSLIAAARDASGVRQRVSTVDNAESAVGQASTVGALVEQLAGRSGQYGLAAGARSAFAAG